MPKRKQIGERNLIGQTVVHLRNLNDMDQQELLTKLQIKGIDISQPSLSRLEGQKREASDREVLALSQIFQVPMERLFQPHEE